MKQKESEREHGSAPSAGTLPLKAQVKPRFIEDQRSTGAEWAPTNGTDAIFALASGTMHQILYRKRTILLAFFMLLPAIVAVIVITNVKDPKPLEDFSGLYNGIYLNILILLVSLILAVNLFHNEFKEHTISYLFIRPLPRWKIYVGKLTGLVIAQIVIVLPSILITFFIMLGKGTVGFYWDDLGGFLVISVMAIMVYSTFFTMLGIRFRHPLLIGLVVAFIWEVSISNVGETVRKCTAMYYLRSIGRETIDAELFSNIAKYSSFSTALFVLFSIMAVIGVLSVYFLNNKEVE